MEKLNYTVDLKEGTVSFRIKAGRFNWRNGQRAVFIEVSKKEGSILMLKDEKNKLRVTYRLKPQTTKALSTDVGNLSIQKDHQVALVWSQRDNHICLYLDGQKAAEKKIK